MKKAGLAKWHRHSANMVQGTVHTEIDNAWHGTKLVCRSHEKRGGKVELRFFLPAQRLSLTTTQSTQ